MVALRALKINENHLIRIESVVLLIMVNNITLGDIFKDDHMVSLTQAWNFIFAKGIFKSHFSLKRAPPLKNL